MTGVAPRGEFLIGGRAASEGWTRQEIAQFRHDERVQEMGGSAVSMATQVQAVFESQPEIAPKVG